MRRNSLIAALIVSALLAHGAQAQNGKKNDAGQPTVVQVDFARVVIEFRKSQAYAKLQSDAEKQAQMLQKEMDQLALVRYLTPQELAEYQELKAKPRPSKEELARIEVLEKRSDQLDDEFRGLSLLSTPNVSETTRLRELSQIRQNATTALRGHAARLDDELDKIDRQLANDVGDQVIEAIDKAAKSMKWDAVLDARVVLYGGTDVTDDVIKRLPK